MAGNQTLHWHPNGLTEDECFVQLLPLSPGWPASLQMPPDLNGDSCRTPTHVSQAAGDRRGRTSKLLVVTTRTAQAAASW